MIDETDCIKSKYLGLKMKCVIFVIFAEPLGIAKIMIMKHFKHSFLKKEKKTDGKNV